MVLAVREKGYPLKPETIVGSHDAEIAQLRLSTGAREELNILELK